MPPLVEATGWLPLVPLEFPDIFVVHGIFILIGGIVLDRRLVTNSKSVTCPALKEFNICLELGSLLFPNLWSDGV